MCYMMHICLQCITKMNNEDKHDVLAEIFPQVSDTIQADTQPSDSAINHVSDTMRAGTQPPESDINQVSDTIRAGTQPSESDINQVTLSSTVSRICDFSTDIPGCSTDGYNVLQSIKCEPQPPPVVHEDNEYNLQQRGVNDHMVTCWHGAQWEEQRQETIDTETVLPVKKADQETTWSHDANELIEVEQHETGYSGNREVKKDSAVCLDGVLTDVRTEHMPSSVRVHEKTSTDIESYACTTCGKCFARPGSLKTHEKRHTSVKPFTCYTCGKSFVVASCLRVHDMIHTGVKPFACVTCGKTFRRSTELKSHEIIHTGIKLYACTICGKCFATSSHLKNHKIGHSGIKPFSCKECGQTFFFSSQLKQHETSHSGVKLFNCPICMKTFARSSHLKSHEATHTDIKPYTCSICRII